MTTPIPPTADLPATVTVTCPLCQQPVVLQKDTQAPIRRLDGAPRVLAIYDDTDYQAHQLLAHTPGVHRAAG